MKQPTVTIRPATEADSTVLRTLQSALASPWPDLLDLVVGDRQLGPTCLVADRDFADGDRTDRHDRDGRRGVVGYVLALDGTTGEATTDAEPPPDAGPPHDAEPPLDGWPPQDAGPPQDAEATADGAAACRVVELVVAPGTRRQGIGSALLEALAGRAAADRLWLTVRADDDAAQAFYESQGFSRTGRRPDHYEIDGESRDAVVMTRSLR